LKNVAINGIVFINPIPLSYRIVDIEEYKKAIILFYELNNISYFNMILSLSNKSS